MPTNDHPRVLSILVLLLSSLLLQSATAQAQGCFVLIEGASSAPISALSGTTAAGHSTETEVLSHGFNAFRPVDGSLVPGPVEAQPLRLTKIFDGSSPRLIDAFAVGEVLKTFELTCETPGNNPIEIMRITLLEAVVVGISSGGLPTDPAMETITFGYKTLTWIDPVSGRTGKVTP